MSSQYSPRFWDKYIEKTISYGIRPHQSRWYVRHAEGYFKAHSGSAKTRHDAELVTAYLEQKGRDKRFEAWQFRQLVIALKILFLEMLKPAWAGSYPWNEYADFTRELDENHATVARDYLPDTGDPIPVLQEKADVDKESLHKQVRLLYPQYIDILVQQIQVKHYSIRTEQAYRGWLIRYIAFHQMKDPATLSDENIAAFLDHLVLKRKVAASTQMQALNALVFFYRQVLQRKPGEAIELARTKRPKRLPVVLSRPEVVRLLADINGPTLKLMAQLLYGCGMRLMECIRLRILDIDFDYQQIIIRQAKGNKERVVPVRRRSWLA